MPLKLKDVLPKEPVDRKERQNKQMREYRKRKVEEDPDFLYYENLRIKVYKDSLSEEKKEQYRAKARERLIRWRAEKKEAEGQVQVPKKGTVTRKSQNEQRTKWNDEKRTQRAQMTQAERDRENEKRRERYAGKKLSQNEIVEEESSQNEIMEEEPSQNEIVAEEPSTPSNPRPYRTQDALRKAASRVRGIPTQSDKKAAVLVRIFSRSTPKTKHLFERNRQNGTRCKKRLDYLEKTIAAIREKVCKAKGKDAVIARRLLARAVSTSVAVNKRKCGTILGIGRKALCRGYSTNRIANRPRSDCLSQETKTKVNDFYLRGDNSRALPLPRSVKGGKAVQILEDTLVGLYKKLMSENTNLKLSFSKFKALKPSTCKPMTLHKHEACLCEYCTNILFKLQSLKFSCSSKPIPMDKYRLSEGTLCPKQGANYALKCINRKCDNCGPEKFLESLDIIGQKTTQTSWWRWENGTVLFAGVEKKRLLKKRKEGTLDDLLSELNAELQPFSRHLFDATWQCRQYQCLEKNRPQGTVLFCCDFGENVKVINQDEAQAAHWSNIQVTIHPVVATYECPEDGCTETVTDTMIFLSDDNKHCADAVHHFTTTATQVLKDDGIAFSRVIQFSDGAASQYKNKTAFNDASFGKEDAGCTMERHFFGSRHGKGPCDREIGVFKKQLRFSVLARQSFVADAKDMVAFGEKKLLKPKDGKSCHDGGHTKRRFFHVEVGQIKRARRRTQGLIAAKDTRSLHSIVGVAPHQLKVRERSCFCPDCESDKPCSNQDVLGLWQCRILKKGIKR